MKLKIQCPKGNRHNLSVEQTGIYCWTCEDYLYHPLLEVLCQTYLEEGKKRGKAEVRTALGI